MGRGVLGEVDERQVRWLLRRDHRRQRLLREDEGRTQRQRRLLLLPVPALRVLQGLEGEGNGSQRLVNGRLRCQRREGMEGLLLLLHGYRSCKGRSLTEREQGLSHRHGRLVLLLLSLLDIAALVRRLVLEELFPVALGWSLLLLFLLAPLVLVDDERKRLVGRGRGGEGRRDLGLLGICVGREKNPSVTKNTLTASHYRCSKDTDSLIHVGMFRH